MFDKKINLRMFDDDPKAAENEKDPETKETETKTSKSKAKTKEPEQTPEEYLEERVPVMLFKDGDKYKDDVVLAINGEKVQIQRGVQVYIKRKFMHVLENQYRQQMIAADMQDKLANEYADATRARGIQA